MRKYIALGALLSLGLGGQAMAADGFSYNLGELAYIDTDGGDGWAVRGQAEIGRNLSVLGSFTDYDGGNWLNAGLGVNWGLNPSLDLVGALTFERAKADGGGSETGFGIAGGLRGRVFEQLELTAGLKYVDMGNGWDDTTLSAGGRWYFTPNFAAGIDFSDNDGGNAWALAVRYDFGRRY